MFTDNTRVRLKAENDRLRQEIALLREEIRIKDLRIVRIPPHRRPFYPPTERMAILELKAARAWSLEQTARAFLVTSLGMAQRRPPDGQLSSFGSPDCGAEPAADSLSEGIS